VLLAVDVVVRVLFRLDLIMERRNADMNQHQREEFLLIYGPRKEGKAVKDLRKVREQAQKQS
jgi:hypothetical protein